ncbi:nucleolar protein 6-like [Diaphorina citri]|uniref:Nucleolar protein 6 n=1 Tax=Diaphorina citri TaxID=121845 RepID=A0A3Q0IZX2_DIACI|nr:nucleolar protein 6-like [Diaphorina citri]
MPKRMLHTGDHLNERYWRKKLTYLSLIASHLTEHRTQLSILSVQYRTTGEPGLYCVSLLVTPEPSVGKKVKLNIIAVPEDKGNKLSRCYPQACNIRSEWLGKQIEGGATPHYNTLLARDMTVRQNYEYIKSSFERGGDNMRHAYLLLCVWLQQRQLSQGRGTLSQFTLSLYLCRLLARKKLNPSMSSYQMLRNVWVQLGSSEDWTSDGTDSEPVTMETYRQYFPVVFVDSTGLYNVTSDMSKDFYLLLKEEAKLAVSCLDDINLDSFRLLFMTPAPFLRQFDHYICFNNRDKLESVVSKYDHEGKCLDRGQGPVARFADLLVTFLKDSLEERLSSVTYRTYPVQVCTELGGEYKEGGEEDGSCLIVGIRLNSDACFKLIHRGPEANLPEAAQFRQLWGDKSELRRFKDGTVCEASVWGSNSDPWSVRRVVTREMIVYLLEKRWGLERKEGRGDFVYLANDVDTLIHKQHPGVGQEESTVAILKEWDTLARQLRDMNSLPLDICSVLPTAEVLRYSDPQPPVPYASEGSSLMSANTPVPPLVKPVEGVIEVSASGKWPEDINAIARLKAAFYLELAGRLKTITKATPNYLDVYQVRVSSFWFDESEGQMAGRPANTSTFTASQTRPHLCHTSISNIKEDHQKTDNIMDPRQVFGEHSLECFYPVHTSQF